MDMNKLLSNLENVRLDGRRVCDEDAHADVSDDVEDSTDNRDVETHVFQEIEYGYAPDRDSLYIHKFLDVKCVFADNMDDWKVVGRMRMDLSNWQKDRNMMTNIRGEKGKFGKNSLTTRWKTSCNWKDTY